MLLLGVVEGNSLEKKHPQVISFTTQAAILPLSPSWVVIFCLFPLIPLGPLCTPDLDPL
jgi:hypothetical protein